MLDIDEVINNYNKTELQDKIAAAYYKVLTEEKDKDSTITTAAYFPEKDKELIYLKARSRFLEDLIYRLFTGSKSLSTGMFMELMRIIEEKEPGYFNSNEIPDLNLEDE